ncbi:energy-coupling factor transporter transmembrane component T [Zhihengliuella sp.]|uniref:energy-coupling factor transporter transmembrane component T family protein n=1 Tax=Zhihengliuella sp. TaxID=1954483 RepID=UPI0028112762|nr:energy-coupling factor transporter transmembrane component T [Zhihengliuella sp.]
MHPFTVLAVAALVVTSTTALAAWPVSLSVVLVCLGVAATRGRLAAVAAASTAILVPVWCSQLMIHALFDRAGTHVLLEAGWLRLTSEGLTVAAQLGLRLAVLVVVGATVAVAVDRHRLVAAIDLAPVPPQAGYLLAATLALVPRLQRRRRAIADAQALRLLDAAPEARRAGPLRRAWRAVRLQAVPLVLSSVQDAAERAPHLAARGFPSTADRRTRLRDVPDSRLQRLVRRAAAVGAVVVPALILIGGAG